MVNDNESVKEMLEDAEGVSFADVRKESNRRRAGRATRSEDEAEKRPKRVPFGVSRLKTQFHFRDPAEQNKWHLHMAEESNVDIYLEGGYEYVHAAEVAAAPGSVASGKDAGNKVRIQAGRTERGEPIYGYLLKIKMEDYLEDRDTYARLGRDHLKGATGKAVNDPNLFVSSISHT